ncbi:hypothetical protein C8R47DRAFT_1168003 [Mycena vitilis]|nr:hypothetical protein C8R47DRAFT_1168003 [Mycena vitilis]
MLRSTRRMFFSPASLSVSEHPLIKKTARVSRLFSRRWGGCGGCKFPLSKPLQTLLNHTCIPTGRRLENAQKRLRYLAVVLIEQHANVNATLEWQGTVVLSVHIARILEDWELVALLLEHGAQSKPGPVCTEVKTFLHDAAARRRFNDLQAEYQPHRPPTSEVSVFLWTIAFRVSLPEPSLPRSLRVRMRLLEGIREMLQSWWCPNPDGDMGGGDEVDPGLAKSPFSSRDVFVAGNSRCRYGVFQRRGRRMRTMLFRLIGDPTSRILWTEALDIACREKLADAAFVFAYLMTGFFPIFPVKGKEGKERCHEKQKEWNAAVEAYIDSGIDTRPHSEIKRAAKLGASMGAMYPACHAEDCGRVGGEDVEKLMACAGCQRAFYCATRCQRLHWPTHKKVCGTNRPQLLPSQKVLCDFVVKYSAMKWWLSNHGHGETDPSAIARVVLSNEVESSSTASPAAAASSSDSTPEEDFGAEKRAHSHSGKEPVTKFGQRISDLKGDLDACLPLT